MGSTSYITDASGEVYQHLETEERGSQTPIKIIPNSEQYSAFGGTFVEEHSNTDRTPYLFNGKELDEETGLYYYGARYYDERTSIWLSVDPLAEKYPGFSPYVYVSNRPTIAVDPNGRDIIFIVDSEAADDYGHIAVLIGNETDGWTYVSINGTGEGAKPWGKSKNADIGTLIIGEEGNKILDPEKAIQRANDINPDENHSYDSYKRIKSSNKEDKNALVQVKKLAATEKYGIAGPGKSCIDIAQTAFESLVEDRDLDAQWWKVFKDDISGESDLIPNNWFDKLEERVKSVNKNGDENSTKIELIPTENL